MATPMEFIKENQLDWQPSFNGAISDTLHGYRGSLIVEEGKSISSSRKLPPKIQARQVIMVTENETIKFFACELESFHDLAPMYAKYKEFFTTDTLTLLYVTDLEGNGSFEYEGIPFTAYMLDESTVWNELLELATLEKSDMKQFKKNEQKIKKIYEGLLETDTIDTQKSYEEMCALVGESSKQLMGAV